MLGLLCKAQYEAMRRGLAGMKHVSLFERIIGTMESLKANYNPGTLWRNGIVELVFTTVWMHASDMAYDARAKPLFGEATRCVRGVERLG